jgi:ribosomal protein S18 acetylase RimI-like enzyme
MDNDTAMTQPYSNALELRPYRSADLEDCMRIWTAASLAGHPFLSPDDIASDEPLVRETYMPMAQITVALHGRHVVGFIAMVGDFIGALFVSPDHHRLGIGRVLVGFEAERRAAMSVEVYEDNATARAFYEALGFSRTGRRDRDDRGRAYALVQMELLMASAR